MEEQSQKMLQGSLLRNIVTYTIPVILTGLLQLLFNAADLMVVGRFCGSVSVAAVGATTSLTNLIVNLFIGLSVGAGVTVAHAMGAKNEDMVHRTVHTAIPAALISGAVLTLVGVLFSESFLTLMGTLKMYCRSRPSICESISAALRLPCFITSALLFSAR